MENTKCQELVPLLDGYFDNELTDAESAQVQAHLAECAHCLSQLAEIQVVSKGLAAMPRLSLGKDLAPEIMAQVKEKPKAKVLLFKRKQIWVAAAACLVLAFGFQFLNKPQVKVSEMPTRQTIEKEQPLIAEQISKQVNEVEPKGVATNLRPKQEVVARQHLASDQNVKPKVLIASSTNDDVLAFDYGYQPNLMEGMGLATDEDGLYALKM